MHLSAEELRILGCLVEKAFTTPDNYPLSTNALVNACNQKTNREPVVDYSERLVDSTMLDLRSEKLARSITSGRTVKHRHVLDEALQLAPSELSLLAVLILRGPQTPGELRIRTERYVQFETVEAVDAVLRDLADRPETLVANLGRGPGQSQDRWVHCLGESPSASANGAPAPAHIAPDHELPHGESRSELAARVSELESRLARIELELGL